MAERVDVLAYDRDVDRPESDRKRQRRLSLGAYGLVAVLVGYGVLQAELLSSAVGALLVLGVRYYAFGAHRTVETVYRAVEAGRSEAIVRAHEVEARKRDQMRSALVVVVVGGVLAYGYVSGSLLVGAIGGGVVAAVAYVTRSDPELPRVVETDVDRDRAAREFELADPEETEREDQEDWERRRGR